MNDPIRLELKRLSFQVERLESNMRRLDERTMELSKHSSVLNSKVETALDNQTANSFLEEEIPEERARSAHQAVQSVSQANA